MDLKLPNLKKDIQSVPLKHDIKLKYNLIEKFQTVLGTNLKQDNPWFGAKIKSDAKSVRFHPLEVMDGFLPHCRRNLQDITPSDNIHSIDCPNHKEESLDIIGCGVIQTRQFLASTNNYNNYSFYRA